VHRNVLHNREIRAAGEAILAPGQVGFLNGWGIFSTLRVAQGALFAFERHFARLQRDAKLLHVPFTWSANDLHSNLLTLVAANGADEAVLRVAIVRNKGGLFEGPDIRRDCDLIAFTADLKAWGKGAKLCTVKAARLGTSPFAGTKTTSWIQNLTWLEEAQQQGFDEALLLNEHGHVSECTSANIFAIKGKQIFTPPLTTSGCLPGVTRAILLEEVKVDGLAISEQTLSVDDLLTADSVFMTSTTRDLLPVLAIDGRGVSGECEAFHQLRSAFLRVQAESLKETSFV
jgi:branched-chain amino acid aminotransferase